MAGLVVVLQLAGRDLALLKGINTLIDWAKRTDNTSVTIAIATGSSIGAHWSSYQASSYQASSYQASSYQASSYQAHYILVNLPLHTGSIIGSRQ